MSPATRPSDGPPLPTELSAQSASRRASVCAALTIALVPLLWLWYGGYRASYSGLGRDQGIFQGTAWSILHGDVLYRDLREINGPLVHEIHLLVVALFGIDSHALRSFDLLVSAAIFALVGAALPRGLARDPASVRAGERVAWGAAGCALLMAQYVAFYDYWNMTQRESFFGWFVLGALACDLHGRASEGKAAARWLGAAGALSVLPWFGKPTCVAYTLLHGLMIGVAEPPAGVPRRKQLLAFAAGMAVGVYTQLLFLRRFGSLADFARAYLLENPRYYRYIVRRAATDFLLLEGHTQYYPLAIGLTAGALGLIAVRRLPRRSLGIALFPLVAIGLDVLQYKGYPYHLHPITAGTALLALTLVCKAGLAGRDGSEDRHGSSLWPLALSSLVALQAANILIDCANLRQDWAPDEGATRASRLSPEFLRHYGGGDFPSAELAEAGEFLKRHTRPNDKIQLYGMDPYLLALAERRSATPYIYDIDINPQAVLDGIQASGGSVADAAFARELANRHARDLASRVLRSPPAAFVFFDNAPFTWPKSARAEFEGLVPELAAMLKTQYASAQRFGLLDIYLRNGLWRHKPKRSNKH